MICPLLPGSAPISQARDGIVAEAVSGRPQQPTYEELWGEAWRQPRHEPFRDAERAAFWFSPVLAALFAIVLGSMSLVGLKEQIVRAVPASGALYAAIGMPVNVRGLGVSGRDVAGRRRERAAAAQG